MGAFFLKGFEKKMIGKLIRIQDWICCEELHHKRYCNLDAIIIKEDSNGLKQLFFPRLNEFEWVHETNLNDRKGHKYRNIILQIGSIFSVAPDGDPESIAPFGMLPPISKNHLIMAVSECGLNIENYYKFADFGLRPRGF